MDERNKGLNLRALKGAPLSILICLALHQNECCSAKFLMGETGYSDKSVQNGLEILISLGYVQKAGYRGWALVSGFRQLPISWDAQELTPPPLEMANNESRKISDTEIFSRKNSDTEIFRMYAEKFRTLEDRVENLERKISGESRKISGECGEIFRNTENFQTIDSINVSTLKPNVNQEELNDEAEFFRKLDQIAEQTNCEKFDDEEKKLIYKTRDSLNEKLFYFFVPRCNSGEDFISWTAQNEQYAKFRLCKFFGIYENIAEGIARDEKITLQCIDYHFWKYVEERKTNKQLTIGSVVSRIIGNWNAYEANELYELAPENYYYLKGQKYVESEKEKEGQRTKLSAEYIR